MPLRTFECLFSASDRFVSDTLTSEFTVNCMHTAYYH